MSTTNPTEEMPPSSPLYSFVESTDTVHASSTDLLPKGVDLEDATCTPLSEDLSPSECPTASFTSCTINLLKTILGAGMLALPSAFAIFGYVPGVALVIFAALLAAFGLHLFVLSSQFVGRSATINRLASITYPRLTTVFDLMVAIKCFGVAVSYLVVISNVGPDIVTGVGLQRTFPILLSRHIWLFIAAFLLVPLAFLKRMDSLKYTSFLGSLSVVYLVGVTVWTFFDPTIRPSPGSEMRAFGTLSLDACKSFATFVFSFTCHQNIFPIQKEAVDNSTKFMDRVINLSVGLSSLFYLLFTLSSYSNFGQDVKGNVLMNYPTGNVEIIIARILFAFLAAFSYPLQTLPCRQSLENILPISKAFKSSNSNYIHILLTIFILIGTFGVAVSVSDLSIISQFIGTFTSIPVCYILPFVFYYKLTEGRGWTLKRIGAACLALFGVIAILINGYSLFASLLPRLD